MLAGWNAFKGWKVLEFFLQENKFVHVKGLARALKISSATAQHYLSEYEKNGILEKEKTANTLNYRLKETPLTMELKKALFLSTISGFLDKFRKENPHVSVLALYGSHAKGTFDKQSDIDLLVISQQKIISAEKSIKELEKKTAKEAKIQVFSIAQWNSLIKRNDPFAISVLKNHIILYGEEL